MRHRRAGWKLGRNTEHRRALLRNLVTSLIVEERIETTLTKAKAMRPHVEKMITLGKRRHVSALAQGNHLLYMRTHGLRLGQRGLNALLHDQRGHQVAQQCAPVLGVPSQFPSCSTMTHVFGPSQSRKSRGPAAQNNIRRAARGRSR